jgi:type II secretory pathway pseudopilin PulG
MRHRNPRPAFTLSGLLVLLALLGILIGLFLPAIQKVREAAARAQSLNNMKQLGLAVHNYADVNNHMPPGVDANNFSATAYLLPYVEQDNVFKLIDFKKPSTDKANADVRGILIKTFLDPRDPVMKVVPDAGPTNYLFNAGSKYDLKDNDGVFFKESKITFADITDGTSNTLMTGATLKGDGGKTAADVRRQYVLLDAKALKDLTDESGVADFKKDKHIAGDRCASWLEGQFLQGTFTATRAGNDERPDVSCGGDGGLSALRSLDSNVVVGMCDGSVRTVSKKLDLDVWKNLGARNDGNVIPDF